MKSSVFWQWAERILLVCVLSLQVTILVNGRGSRPAAVETDDQLSQLAPRPTPFLVGSTRRGAALTGSPLEGTAVPPYISNVRSPDLVAGQVYSRMGMLFEQAVRDLDRLRYMDRSWNSLVSSPAMDMRDRGTEYQVTFCVPGADESQVEVQLYGQLLTVEMPVGAGGSGQPQRIRRRLQLPGAVGPQEMASAVLSNGVLRIVLPKCDEPVTGPVNLVAYRLL